MVSNFNANVELVVQEFPFESEQQAYEEFLKKSPNQISKEAFQGIYFAALREIEHRVKKFEDNLNRLLQTDGEPSSQWLYEQRVKPLNERWAYMMFHALIWLMPKLNRQGQKLAHGLISQYREIWDKEN